LTKQKGADANKYLQNFIDHEAYGLAYIKLLNRVKQYFVK